MASSANPKPKILFISLALLSFFDEQYTHLIDIISNTAAIQRVKTRDSALNRIKGKDTPKAILITDAALANESVNAPVWDAVLDYVRRGGTAIVMGHFSSFVQPDNILPFFRKAGLSWKRSDYHRTDTGLNRSVVVALDDANNIADRLPAQYSQKALMVEGVTDGDIWYAAMRDSMTQSLVFTPENAYKPGQAAVAMARVGEGRLAYLGDVNSERESQDVILAMCGFL